VVDELILFFTHDCPIDFMLPGIPPTGRKVAVPHVVVMKFEGGKIAHEHIYWDQAGVLAQISTQKKIAGHRSPASGGAAEEIEAVSPFANLSVLSPGTTPAIFCRSASPIAPVFRRWIANKGRSRSG
jgi:SnoaL-like polyketide cyclase